MSVNDPELELDSFRSALEQVQQIKPKPKAKTTDKRRTTVVLNRRALDLLGAIAEHEGVTASQVLGLILEVGLGLYASGELDGLISQRRTTSSSPAYSFKIESSVGPDAIEALAERLDLPQLLILRN